MTLAAPTASGVPGPDPSLSAHPRIRTRALTGAVAVCLALAFPAQPILAETPALPGQPAPGTAGDEGAGTDGTSLMEEGLKLMMRGLMTEMEPALDDMRGMLGELGDVTDQLGPQLQSILDLMGDVRFYELPERLPNGDILIRRKADAPPAPPFGVPTPSPETAPQPAPEIEL